MLWTCLHFPDLPLHVFARADARGRGTVVSSVSHRPDVICANRAAQRRGIVAGMSIAAALALDGELSIHLRDERAEALALSNIALWAGQWTPTISIEPPACVLLEISGCLNYFGGLQALHERIHGGLGVLGFPATIAIAPTPLAASLFARAGRRVTIASSAALAAAFAAALDDLPIALLAERGRARDVIETLSGLGARTLGDVRALPRDGVARRFGQWLLDEIDRAHGRLPDARALFVAPERYEGQIELPSPVSETEALLFAVKRLVVELAGFLQGRGAGVTRLRCDLVHDDAPPTSIVQGLSATRRVEHIMNVLRERLGRESLPSRVEALRLVSEETAPLAAKEGDFFAAVNKEGEAGAQLVERLRARLGEDAVRSLAMHADHRPERAQAWGSATLSMTTTPAALAKRRIDAALPNASPSPKLSSCPKGAMSPDALPSPTTRPLWLMTEPRALEGEPASAQLRLLSGPERIESGWWDGGEIGRDYFVGRDEQGETLWLYRDRGGRWFVHGVFA
ncbi:MAG: DNA polymerase Y family protein [Betaproteobacteria bacterium]